jgi:hypothetical protein
MNVPTVRQCAAIYNMGVLMTTGHSICKIRCREMPMKRLALPFLLISLAATPAFAATLAVTINDAPYTGPSNPKGVKLVANEPFSVDITIKGGKPADPIWLKHGDDVEMNGASNDTKPDADSFTFYLVPMRAGPLTLPGMDIPVAGGGTLHMDPIKLVVFAN